MHIPRNKFSILGLLFRKLSLPHMQNCLHILLHELKILESTLQGSPTRSSTGLSFLNVFLVVPLSAFRITSSFFFFFIAGLPSYSSNPLLIFQSCSQTNFSSFFFYPTARIISLECWPLLSFLCPKLDGCDLLPPTFISWNFSLEALWALASLCFSAIISELRLMPSLFRIPYKHRAIFCSHTFCTCHTLISRWFSCLCLAKSYALFKIQLWQYLEALSDILVLFLILS